MFTFKQIQHYGLPIQKTDLYSHYHFAEFLNLYDGNFIAFHRMPSLDEFLDVEEYLRSFHEERGQTHLKFIFLENEKIQMDVQTYLTKQKYDIGFLELYAIDPMFFPSVEPTEKIVVKEVDEQWETPFLQMQFDHDQQYGEAYAIRKQWLIKGLMESKEAIFVGGTYKGEFAGSLTVYANENTLEIDNLAVGEKFRMKGIAKHLQHFVMKLAGERPVILVADGEDTPKEMYKKQGYTYEGVRYEALKK